MASKSSPPKPWEVRKTGAASSSVPVSSSVARSALEPTDPTAGLPMDSSGRNPHIGSSTATSSPRVPPRPGMSSGMSSYGSSPYASRQYGSSYGSNYGTGYGSGYGSSYGSNYGTGYGSSYSGYGSSYGGYGSSTYGSGYGSGLGGYGSRYGSGYGGYGSSYGSSYGGYGSSGYGGGYGNSYGRYGYGYQERPPVGEGGALQSVLNGGYNQMNRFGMVVDSFSRFTRLLDANFDALHGSFASVLRLLDVFGEFFYVVRTFAVFRLIFGGLGRGWRILNFLVGRTNKRLQSGKDGLEVEDYKKFQSSQGRKGVPMVLVVMGIICVSLPLLLIKLWRSVSRMKLLEGFEDTPLDDAWKGDAPPSLVRARHGFAGESEMDLPFREGDLIRLLGKPFPDWWEGEINGRRGLFPAEFVEEVKEEPKQM